MLSLWILFPLGLLLFPLWILFPLFWPFPLLLSSSNFPSSLSVRRQCIPPFDIIVTLQQRRILLQRFFKYLWYIGCIGSFFWINVMDDNKSTTTTPTTTRTTSFTSLSSLSFFSLGCHGFVVLLPSQQRFLNQQQHNFVQIQKPKQQQQNNDLLPSSSRYWKLDDITSDSRRRNHHEKDNDTVGDNYAKKQQQSTIGTKTKTTTSTIGTTRNKNTNNINNNMKKNNHPSNSTNRTTTITKTTKTIYNQNNATSTNNNKFRSTNIVTNFTDYMNTKQLYTIEAIYEWMRNNQKEKNPKQTSVPTKNTLTFDRDRIDAEKKKGDDGYDNNNYYYDNENEKYLFHFWTSHDETNFIRWLSYHPIYHKNILTFHTIVVFVEHYARYKNVYLYTAFLQALKQFSTSTSTTSSSTKNLSSFRNTKSLYDHVPILPVNTTTSIVKDTNYFFGSSSCSSTTTTFFTIEQRQQIGYHIFNEMKKELDIQPSSYTLVALLRTICTCPYDVYELIHYFVFNYPSMFRRTKQQQQQEQKWNHEMNNIWETAMDICLRTLMTETETTTTTTTHQGMYSHPSASVVASMLYNIMMQNVSQYNQPTERFYCTMFKICTIEKDINEAEILVHKIIRDAKIIMDDKNKKEGGTRNKKEGSISSSSDSPDIPTLGSPRIWGAALQVCTASRGGGDTLSSRVALNILQVLTMYHVQPNVRHCTAYIRTLLPNTQKETTTTTVVPSSSTTTSTNSVVNDDGMEQQNEITMEQLQRAVDFIKYMALSNTCDNDKVDASHSPPASIVLYEQLSETFRFVLAAPPDTNTLYTVLKGCSYVSALTLGWELLRDFKLGHFGKQYMTSIVDERCYNTLLDCCDSNNMDQIKEIIREMRLTRRYRVGVIPPSHVTYTKAITICRKARDVPSALFLLNSAKNDGVPPDLFMYTAAIWTAAQAHDVDTALTLLAEMKENGCVPNIITYNGVIAALAAGRRPEEAVYVVYSDYIIKNKLVPTYITYFHLASSIGSFNAPDEEKLTLLWRIYGTMGPSHRKVEIGGPILELLISAYGALGHYEEAFMIFNSITGPANAGCLRAILFACSAADPPRWEEALELLHSSDIVSESMSPGNVDAGALCNAMIATSKANEWKESLKLLRLYGTKGNVSIAAINSLIAACGRGGRPDMAMEILIHEMNHYGLKPDNLSYRNAIIACNQAEHLERKLGNKSQDKTKRNSLEKIRQDSLYNDDDDDDDLSLNEISFQWWECAISLLRRMKESGTEPDTPTLSSAISACEAAGQWQTALGILQSTIDNIGKNPVEGVDQSNTLSSSALNLYCFNAAISACEKGGAWVEALEIFERMKEYGGKELRPSVVTFGSMILALDNAGQKELATSIYEEGLEAGSINPWRITLNSNGEKVKAMDLHRFSAAMTRAALRSYMDGLLSNIMKDKNVLLNNDLIIITGKGLRSGDNAPVLMPVVRTLLLDEYSIETTVDKNNHGRIIISSRILKDFVTKKNWR